jgi:hypothetical protein
MNHPGIARRIGCISRALVPLLLAALATHAVHANPVNQSAPWKLNGNGYPGDVTVQQAPDGGLSGSIYGDPLTGNYAPGERIGVWLRGPAGRPIQAFIGQASPDGMNFSGRLYALNTSNAGASPARNVFAFSAQRAAPAAPGNPGVPASAAGPASVAGAHQINGNGFVGPLQLNQAPDGTLTGAIYGQMLEGHYASGTGSIALIRYSAPGQPFQLFVGSVTPQGMRGEFYALNGGAGASLQRMRYEWTAQASAPAGAYIGPAPRTQAATSLPALPAPPAPPVPPPVASTPAPAPAQPATLTGWAVVKSTVLSVPPLTEGSVVAQCPPGSVVTGFADTSSGYNGDFVIERAPLPDGSGFRFTTYAGNALPVAGIQTKVSGAAICVSRPEGYEIVQAQRQLVPRQAVAAAAACPAGKSLVGGGTRTGRAVFTASSAPRTDGGAWEALFDNHHLLNNQPAEVYAICVSQRLMASRRVIASPPARIGPDAYLPSQQLTCTGQRGLSAGLQSTATKVTGQIFYLPAQTPTNNSPPHTWWAPVTHNFFSLIEGMHADVSVRAICADVQ